MNYLVIVNKSNLIDDNYFKDLEINKYKLIEKKIKKQKEKQCE